MQINPPVNQYASDLSEPIKTTPRSLNILIVDDDPLDREHLIRSLQSCEFTCNIEEVSTVDSGISAYKTNKFDIVLLDYRMPQRDGLEMVVELRNDAKVCRTPIVMMSTLENEELTLKCIKAGAQDFLLKSEITVARLWRAILQASARVQLENELYTSHQKVKVLAETDALTGLPNRYCFDEALKRHIKSSKRDSLQVVLILLDLDEFKIVNDIYGHEMGDILLNKVVSRIKGCLRGDELFSRLGGDEFSITLSGQETIDGAMQVSRRIVNILKKPFCIDHVDIRSSASIGISVHPHNGNTAEELFKYADIAMYRAKKQGRNQICFYEESMQRQFSYRVKVENGLRMAIERSELYLHYQPVIHPKLNLLTGFEALLRWKTENEHHYPDKFIPIAEDTRQIIPIGRWVINESIKTIAKWNRTYHNQLSIAINLSSVQLDDEGLVEFIRSCLTYHDVSALQVDIELTETAFLKETSTALKTIVDIHQLGCRLALDDFGTGYSSISHLSNFPVSTVKIDKSLMPTSEADTKNENLVEGLVAMIRILGLDVVAEGVETDHHVSLCNKLSIDRAQGFHYYRPLSVQDAEALCKRILMPH